MRAEMQRDVPRLKLAERRPILRPVRVVAHASIADALLLVTLPDACKQTGDEKSTVNVYAQLRRIREN